MRVVQGEARRAHQRRNLQPAAAAAAAAAEGPGSATDSHPLEPAEGQSTGLPTPPDTESDDDFSDSDVDDLWDSNSDAGSETSYSGESDDDAGQDDQDEGDFYRGLIQTYEDEGPTLADRGDSAKKMVESEEKKWQLFCDMLRKDKNGRVVRAIDEVELLRQCHAPTFKSYLHWRCKRSKGGIKKESTIITYWKVLSMLYCDKAANWMEGKVLYDIGNWISVKLAPEFGLDTTAKNKSGLYTGDLDLMLHHHMVLDKEVLAHERLRVQLSLALILAGATSTRPGALIGNLCYKDIQLKVFPPLPGSQRARVGMVITLRKTKRTAGKSRPKKYGFHEEDTLLRDPIMYVESLAFADGAFANDIVDPEQIYDLRVPAGQTSIDVPWKQEWMERPIFRDIQGRGKKVTIAVDRALRYGKARKLLVCLGRALGYEKLLEWYDLRRGSGKRLNKALTAEERNQSMGHTLGDSSTYVKFYMTDFIEADFQEIVFGSEPQRDIIQLMGRLLRRADAPTRLTDQQMKEVHRHPRLSRLRHKKQQTVRKIQEMGFTLKTVPKTGRGGELLQEYTRWSRMADSARKTLHDDRLTRAINDFHSVRDGEEIARQLQGIRPSEYLAPPAVEYQLPERARVAKLLSQVADVTSADELFSIRMDLVRTLMALCKLQEPRRPRQRRKSAAGKKSNARPRKAPPARQPKKRARPAKRARKQTRLPAQAADSASIESSFSVLTLQTGILEDIPPPLPPGGTPLDGMSCLRIEKSAGEAPAQFSFENCMMVF